MIYTSSCVSSSLFLSYFVSSHRIGFFQNLLWSRFFVAVCVPSQSSSCDRECDRANYNFPICLTWQVANERHSSMSHVHTYFVFQHSRLVVISIVKSLRFTILVRRQDTHTHPIIDIRSMNAVINFWACFVSCLSCVRLRRVQSRSSVLFSSSFLFSFFFESVVCSRSVILSATTFFLCSTASWATI